MSPPGGVAIAMPDLVFVPSSNEDPLCNCELPFRGRVRVSGPPRLDFRIRPTVAHWLARRARPKKESPPGRKLANQKTTATPKVAAACGVLYRSGSEFPLQAGPDKRAALPFSPRYG